jgi:hypothetical protein
MTELDEIRGRIAQITQFQEVTNLGWPFFCAELARMEHELTESLITQESEATRGQIKLLRRIKELPETLQAEREGLNQGLPE